MPHSIFFTKIGHAIHGTDSESRLGTPASHGCVRLSRANASTLYALVEKEGVLNTTVTLTGSSQIALARNPRTRANTAVARRDAGRAYRAAIQRRRRSRRADAAAAGPASIAPQARRRRRLHLSGRRQLGRRALSGAAQQPAPLRRAGLSAATAAIPILRQPRLRAAICARRAITPRPTLPAARAVHLLRTDARNRQRPAVITDFAAQSTCGTSAAARGPDRAATSRPARRHAPWGRAGAAPGRASASPGRRGSSKAAPRGRARPAARRRLRETRRRPRRGAPGRGRRRRRRRAAARCASARQISSRSRSRLCRMSAKIALVVGAGHVIGRARRDDRAGQRAEVADLFGGEVVRSACRCALSRTDWRGAA